MKIKIFQVNLDRDAEAVAFESLEITKKTLGTESLNEDIYDKVFVGDVECDDLEDIYRMFNLEQPEGYKGRLLSVSDVVEIVEADDVEPGFYFCDSIGYKKIDFNPDRCIEKQSEKITVVMVEPGKIARIEEIETDLKSLQVAVGGDIELMYPFEDDVCLICNEEGKITGQHLNRAIYADGEMIDIIAGTFFLCDANNPEFGSLSEDLQKKYLEMFRLPENFIRINGKIEALKYNPEEK